VIDSDACDQLEHLQEIHEETSRVMCAIALLFALYVDVG